jgi:hypothetical protein
MTAEEILYAVVDALEALGVAYMVVGSFSSSLYRTPRMTTGRSESVPRRGPP